MAVIFGTELDDTLTGGEQSDRIFGLAGNDTLSGLGGNDFLDGGDGIDRLDSGSGDDLLYGGDGNDYLEGNDGNDLLFGGDGDDSLFGENGGFLIYSGNNTSDDILYGGEGQDTLSGGLGDDILYGENDNDTLLGGRGNDRLLGGAGDDILNGTRDATFSGGRGRGEIDTLTGKAGTDTFVFEGYEYRTSQGPSYTFNGDSDYALITDFNQDEDVIQLQTNQNDYENAANTVRVEYSLGASPSGLPAGTALYANNLGTQPDLIAVLQDVDPNSVSLSAPYFQFVDN